MSLGYLPNQCGQTDLTRAGARPLENLGPAAYASLHYEVMPAQAFLPYSEIGGQEADEIPW